MSPAGNEPELIDHVYGVVPPVAERVAVYDEPVVPAGSEVVVMEGGCAAAATTMLRFAAALFAGELESVTVTLKDAVPEAVGVPLI